MADVEATSPEGDAPVTEEPTAPQVERKSSIGDMVKDLENAYEEAQVEIALLSEHNEELHDLLQGWSQAVDDAGLNEAKRRVHTNSTCRYKSGKKNNRRRKKFDEEDHGAEGDDGRT